MLNLASDTGIRFELVKPLIHGRRGLWFPTPADEKKITIWVCLGTLLTEGKYASCSTIDEGQDKT
ncbi:hypothetical protein AWENTII_005920 [Aspergillus wentii]